MSATLWLKITKLILRLNISGSEQRPTTVHQLILSLYIALSVQISVVSTAESPSSWDNLQWFPGLLKATLSVSVVLSDSVLCLLVYFLLLFLLCSVSKRNLQVLYTGTGTGTVCRRVWSDQVESQHLWGHGGLFPPSWGEGGSFSKQKSLSISRCCSWVMVEDGEVVWCSGCNNECKGSRAVRQSFQFTSWSAFQP